MGNGFALRASSPMHTCKKAVIILPEVLVAKIRELLEHSPLRGNIVKSPNAPVWIPLNGKQYFVVTCPNCLRSFSLPTPKDLEDNTDTQLALRVL